MIRSGRPPVIVIGMHRSGTSMLAGKLDDAGLFLGRRQQPEHHEAVFFQELNDWLLQQAGASWDDPALVRHLVDNGEARAVAVEYLRYSLRSPRAVSFLGLAGYARTRDIVRLEVPWGWKDPRTTYTLPLWLDVFPEAKVVHVMRHGLDVARSLQVRAEGSVATARERFERKRWHYLLRGKRSGFTKGLRFASLDDGLAVWDGYTSEARRHVADLGDRALELRYEDFLADPLERMAELARFCGLDPSMAELRASVASVRSGRALAHEADAVLVSVAGAQRDRLARHGY